MEGAGEKWKRVLLMITAKLDIRNELECGENHNKLMKEYGIGSSTIRYTKAERQAAEILFIH
jgi:hypothetical protein